MESAGASGELCSEGPLGELGRLKPLQEWRPHLGLLREACNLVRLDERVPIAAERLALRLDDVTRPPEIDALVGVHVLQRTAQNRLVHLGEKRRPIGRVLLARESLAAPSIPSLRFETFEWRDVTKVGARHARHAAHLLAGQRTLLEE